MDTNEPCLRCGSSAIIPDARVQQYDNTKIVVSFDTKPDAAFFNGTQYQALKARVCGECGHAELYVEKAGELWALYQQSQRR
jgi:predicted nucleic-acid-binding Zn-ribbon protein